VNGAAFAQAGSALAQALLRFARFCLFTSSRMVRQLLTRGPEMTPSSSKGSEIYHHLHIYSLFQARTLPCAQSSMEYIFLSYFSCGSSIILRRQEVIFSFQPAVVAEHRVGHSSPIIGHICFQRIHNFNDRISTASLCSQTLCLK
jgi:hypothetical protein